MSSLNHYFFKINQEVITHGEIFSVAKAKLHQPLSDWEQEFYAFILEWFDDRDFIEVNTSGSTGQPKAIQLPKAVMEESAARTISFFGLNPGDRLLLSLSCKYIAGKMMVVRALTGQMNLTVVDPSTDLKFLQDEIFDLGAMVPLQVSRLLETEIGIAQIENICHLLIGGSAIPHLLEQKIQSLKTNVVSTYGMTETASHIAIRQLSGESRSDIYICLPGISVRKNQNDCLEIRMEEASSWLQTNDVVEMVSENSFRVLGRADHAIISGGLKYFPEQIEKKLEPYISQPFFITSEPDEKLGQKIVLVIEGEKATGARKKLQETIKKQLPKYEQPRKIVFRKMFERTENGKVLRKL